MSHNGTIKDTVILAKNFVGWSTFSYGNGWLVCHLIACNPKSTWPLERIRVLLAEATCKLSDTHTFNYQLNYVQYVVLLGYMDLELIKMVVR